MTGGLARTREPSVIAASALIAQRPLSILRVLIQLRPSAQGPTSRRMLIAGKSHAGLEIKQLTNMIQHEHPVSFLCDLPLFHHSHTGFTVYSMGMRQHRVFWNLRNASRRPSYILNLSQHD